MLMPMLLPTLAASAVGLSNATTVSTITTVASVRASQSYGAQLMSLEPEVVLREVVRAPTIHVSSSAWTGRDK